MNDSSPTPLEAIRCALYNQTKDDIEELSALDSIFCQDVHFPQYHPAPKIQPEMDPCIWQNWIESLTVVEKNLSWLLKLPHAKFWCQSVNNLSLQAFLDSYLKQTPRIQMCSWPDDVLQVHNAVHRLVFMVYIRLATNKESSKHFITPDFFGELIYENFLFDVPKILDLCAIYGNQTNSPLLGKALSNVFKCQPNYNEDLKQSAETIMQIFHNLDDKCGCQYHSHNSSEEHSSTNRPHRLSEGPSNEGELVNLTLEEFQDIITYASDVSFTLQRFLVDVYPTACTVFQQNVKYLARFYSTSLNILKDSLQKRSIDDLHLRSQLTAHLKVARVSILNVVRQILNECMLLPALRAGEVGDHSRIENLADEYLHILSDLLGEAKFFHDFMRKLPILEDVQSLLQVSPGIDETRASFILGSLGGASGTQRSTPRYNVLVNGTEEQDTRNSPTSNSINGPVSSPLMAEISSEMQSLISVVHDVLPHLDDSFIQSCLLYYDRDCEKTIHALLEGNIPDDLRMIDRQEKSSETSPQTSTATLRNDDESTTPQMQVLQERRNVFDKDEFDVYESSNLDFSRIHKGKKSKPSLEAAHAADMKHIYEKYAMVSDEEEITEGFGSLLVDDCNVYDDEYDDMYDGLGVNANDAGNNDGVLNRRPFVTPRVFLQQKKKSSQESDSTDESEEESSKTKPDHFIANPAEVREKQEQKRRQQNELKNNRRQNKSKPKPDNPSNAAQDRKKKDANKARVANHNRKKMASRKVAKGMGPM